MQTTKIKLGDFYQLEVELSGRIDNQTGERISNGLLGEKISLVAKYWLNQLLTIVTPEVTFLNTQRDELIKKYGTDDGNGMINLPAVITEKVDGVDVSKPNPDFLEFTKELNTLLSEEKEIEYEPIKLSYLEGIESSERFSMIFRFVEA